MRYLPSGMHVKSLVREVQSELGKLELLYDGEQLVGIQGIWGREKKEQRLLYTETGYSELETKKPAIMTRIVTPEAFVPVIRLKQDAQTEQLRICLELEDPLIPQNAGRWVWTLNHTESELEKLDAEGRVAWALDNLPGEYVLSSSFGIQAAVSLHLVNQIRPDIPVILTDTGYLFPETYRFIDELTDKLKLNLKVYRATESAAWQEARYGKLWEQGVEGIEKYNDINKVEPMNRALKELNAQTWFAGLRREQSGSRANLPVLAIQRGVFKVLPIIDWDNRTIYQYLQKHGLKYHPLWDEGYLSVGDTHTTRKWEPGMAEEETRFFGLKRECGLHEG